MRGRGILCAALVVGAIGGVARAETSRPPPPARATRTRIVPDASLVVARGQDVQIDLVNGENRSGRLASFDADAVRLVNVATGDETLVARGLVARLYLAHIPEPRAPSPAPPGSVPTLPELLGRVVALELSGGRERSGILLSFDGEGITLVDRLNGEVTTTARASVQRGGLGAIHDAYHPTPPPPPPPPPVSPSADAARRDEARASARHLGVHLALLPAPMVDYERGLFYGYASVDALVLAYDAVKGESNFLGAAGAGVSLRPSRSSRVRLDITGHALARRFKKAELTDTATVSVTPIVTSTDTYPTYLGFGVGIGVHYTFPSGLALGAKLPAIGFMRNAQGELISGAGLVAYYAGALLALPVLSVGYRF